MLGCAPGDLLFVMREKTADSPRRKLKARTLKPRRGGARNDNVSGKDHFEASTRLLRPRLHLSCRGETFQQVAVIVLKACSIHGSITPPCGEADPIRAADKAGPGSEKEDHVPPICAAAGTELLAHKLHSEEKLHPASE